MKLAVLCLCFLPVAFVTSEPDGQKTKTTNNDVYMDHHRTRPLFARGRLYERQKVRASKKPKIIAIPPKAVARTKTALIPEIQKCSQLGQSCVPMCGCCDPCTSCHCRFFNAICFCRKANVQCGRKAPNIRKARTGRNQSPKQAVGQ